MEKYLKMGTIPVAGAELLKKAQENVENKELETRLEFRNIHGYDRRGLRKQED